MSTLEKLMGIGAMGGIRFDYYVDGANGVDTNDGLSRQTAWKTLQKAEDTATAGKKIAVIAGTYVEDSSVTHGWYITKAMTWKAIGGSVTVKGTGASTRPLYIYGTGACSINGFIFDAETSRATGISCATGVANKRFISCSIIGSTTQAILIAGTTTLLEFIGCSIDTTNTGCAINATGGFTYRNGSILNNAANLLLDVGMGDINISNNILTSNVAVASAGSVIPFRITSTAGTKTIKNNTIKITGAKSLLAVQGAGSGGTIIFSDNVVSVSQSIASPVISVDLGAWTTTMSNNSIHVTGTQVAPVISLTNQVSPLISGNTITTDTTANDVTHIQILSTGTTVTGVQILNNTFTRNTGDGYVVLIGTEGTSANDGKIEAPLVQGNTFNINADSGGLHTIMFGFVLNGIAKYNKINSLGAGYGVVFKSVGTNAYTTGGAFYNLMIGVLVGVRVRDQAGVKVYNNTISATGSTYAIVYISGTTNPSTDVLVKNNIVLNSGTKPLISNDTESLSGFVSDYNLFYATGGGGIGEIGATGYATLALWKAAGYDAYSIGGDPLFVGVADLHLQSGSPAINAGTNLSLTPDLDGATVSDPPDIGCYEFV